MIDVPIVADGDDPVDLEHRLRAKLDRLDPDAVVRLCPEGEVNPVLLPVLRAELLRSIAPPTTTVSVRSATFRGRRKTGWASTGSESG